MVAAVVLLGAVGYLVSKLLTATQEAKQAADLMHSDLRVESAPGVGTTVTLEMPERKG